MRRTIACVVVLVMAFMARADDGQDAVREAIMKGIARLEKGSASYIENRQCFSCHHQALSIAALQSAKSRGFKVNDENFKHQFEFTLESFRPNLAKIVKGQSIPGGNTMSAYALFTLESANHKPDETTAALVEYLLIKQKADGSWPALANRPPTEGSIFTNNANALRALMVYGPDQDAKDADELRTRIDTAFAKGRDWLLKNKPQTTEDKVFRLRGLVSAGAEREAIDAARDLLLKEQGKDGSWAQLPDREGDAYATGSALMALRQAGVKPDNDAYLGAVRYLLKTQRDDGAWIVETRSRPVQTFFDNGDPGGKSQFISFATTGWAVLALLETCPIR